MKILHTLLFVILGIVSGFSQTLWSGAVDSDWNNPANWSQGVPGSGATAVILAAPANQPVYGGATVIDLTIENFGSLTFNSTVYNTGAITNFASATIINDALFVNAGTIFFNNDGNLDNNGSFENYGTYDHAASAILNNASAASFISYGLFNSNGQINNSGQMTIIGDFSNTNGMDNDGDFTISGDASFPASSSLNNTSTGNVDITSTGKLVMNGSLPNDGTISNAGEFLVQNASVLTNTGSVVNSNEMVIAGTFDNDATLTNSSSLMINSAGVLENDDVVQNNGSIILEICAKLIQNAGNNIGGSIANDGLVFEINGTVNEVNGEFGDSFTDINDTPDPVPACKGDLILELDENGIVNFTGEDVDRGRSYGTCGGQLVSYSVTPNSFTTADIGIRAVTLTITDNFGKTASCEDFVNVIPFQEPIVPVDDPDITFSCPTNITLSTQPGAQFAPVSWTEPTAETTCDPAGSGGGTGTPDCSQIPSDFSGYTNIGEINNAKYFVSHVAEDWNTANANAISLGGHLADITSHAENQFIQNGSNPSTGSVWTGLNTVSSPNVFQWTTGVPLDYTNWQSGEPNGSGINYGVRLRKDSGMWTDKPVSDHYQYVVEIPCPLIPACSNVDLTFVFDNYPEDISWTITNGSGAVIASGGDYDHEPDGSTLVENVCLNDGCYDLNIYDSYGDGLCCAYGNGSYTLTDANGSVLASGAQFSSSDINNFCINTQGGGDPELTVTQIGGPQNASNFPAGTTEVAYQVTDACGNEEICTFDVTVDAVPAAFAVTSCSGNVTINTLPGATTAIGTWDDPTGTSDCFRTGPVGVEQTLGLAKGSDFPVGTVSIAYAVFDSCGNFESCLFDVTINQVLSTLDVSGCPDNFNVVAAEGASTATVSWTEPTATTDCFLNSNTTVTQLSGPANGTAFPLGSTEIIYLFADDCSNTEVCSFTVLVNSPCNNNGGDADGDGVCADIDCDDNDPNIPTTPGSACDDGNSNTANDSYEADGCTCSGTIIDPCLDNGGDADGDGICADVDCDDNNGAVPTAPGTVCDDNDPLTQNDVIQIDGCTCAGALPVTISVQDVSVMENAGSVNVDICLDMMSNVDVQFSYLTSSGTALATADFGFGIGNPVISAGLLCTTVSVLIVDDVEEEGDEIFTIDISSPINATIADASGEVTILANDAPDPCINNGGDADGDGICADVDCDDNDATVPATVGSSCDDGDAGTENDVIGADGCSCAGTIIVDCDLTAPVVTLIAANNPSCVGESDGSIDIEVSYTNGVGAEVWISESLLVNAQDLAGIPAGTYEFTAFDLEDCSTSITVTLSDPIPGTACDDGNPDTANDVLLADGCTCEGVPIFTGCNPTYSISGTTLSVQDLSGEHNSINIYNVPGFSEAYACFDNCPSDIELPEGEYYLHIKVLDAGYQITCQVEEYITIPGGPVTCDNNGGDADGDGICADVDCDDTDASLPAVEGTICDDGDPTTENDMIGADGCSCAGTVPGPCDNNGGDADGDGLCADVDCNDNDANLPGTAGASCDDGNANTVDDVIGADGCSCAGTPILNACDPMYEVDGNNITITGLNGAHNAIDIFNTDGWNAVYQCFDDCGDPDVQTLEDGVYYIQIKVLDEGYQIVCQVVEYVTIDGSGGCNVGGTCDDGDSCTDNDVLDADCNCAGVATDADGDGVCANDDCDDNDANVPTAAGTPCDDGDPNTLNDVIGFDGCTCSGTVLFPCTNNGGDADGDGVCADVDCDDSDPNLPAAAGTACDDGDPNTENDVIGADGCSCAGTVVGACDNNGGDADGDGICADVDCDDNNANLPATVGSACDDGDTTTENDIIGADGCSCAGTPISTGCNPMYTINGNILSVTGLNGEHNSINIYQIPGWAGYYDCFDNCPSEIVLPDGEYNLHIKVLDAGYQITCQLQENIIIDGSAACTPGGPCNDGDACTDNDLWDADCNCAGTVTDADGDGVCAADDCDDGDATLPATIGSTCDDGDATTENDVIGADGCTCAGVDPAGCNITVATSPGTITIDGLNGVHVIVQVFDDKWVFVRNCLDDCNDPEVISGLAAGTYYVKAINYDENWNLACDNIDYYTVTGGANLQGQEGAENEETSTEFLVYPNPAAKQVNINLKDFIGQSAEVQIYNQLGQMMDIRSVDSVTEEALTFDLTKYTSGVYAVTIKTENNKRLTKLFVVNKL